MGALIVIGLIVLVLCFMILRSVIQSAIDNSQMARDLADIRALLLESRVKHIENTGDNDEQ
jgi:hypothetical protein